MFENITMTTEMWIGLGVFVVGLIFLSGAFFRKQIGLKLNPVFASVLGVLLVVFGGAVGVLPMLDGGDAATVVNVNNSSDTATEPTFSIDVVNGTTGKTNTSLVNIDEDEESAQVVLQHTNLGGDHLDNCRYASVNFTVTPIPPVGADADTLATVFFETDYDMKYGGEYVLRESSGVWYANWSYAGGTSDEATEDYAASMTMLMTETGYAQIDYCFDSGNSDVFSCELDTVGDAGSWDVTFHNSDWSWSQTIPINWIYIGAS